MSHKITTGKKISSLKRKNPENLGDVDSKSWQINYFMGYPKRLRCEEGESPHGFLEEKPSKEFLGNKRQRTSFNVIQIKRHNFLAAKTEIEKNPEIINTSSILGNEFPLKIILNLIMNLKFNKENREKIIEEYYHFLDFLLDKNVDYNRNFADDPFSNEENLISYCLKYSSQFSPDVVYLTNNKAYLLLKLLNLKDLDFSTFTFDTTEVIFTAVDILLKDKLNNNSLDIKTNIFRLILLLSAYFDWAVKNTNKAHQEKSLEKIQALFLNFEFDFLEIITCQEKNLAISSIISKHKKLETAFAIFFKENYSFSSNELMNFLNIDLKELNISLEPISFDLKHRIKLLQGTIFENLSESVILLNSATKLFGIGEIEEYVPLSLFLRKHALDEYELIFLDIYPTSLLLNYLSNWLPFDPLILKFSSAKVPMHAICDAHSIGRETNMQSYLLPNNFFAKNSK